MELEQIESELRRRFAAPLPEFSKRRIIFWRDAEGEFLTKIEEISLKDVEIVRLTGDNNFAVRKLLLIAKPEQNFLLYDVRKIERPDANYLLNIELYSEEFRADLVSIYMQELHLPNVPALREAVRHYKKYFQAKARRKALGRYGNITTAPQLHRAIMAAIVGSASSEAGAIIRALLGAGLVTAENTPYQEIVNYGAEDALKEMVRQATGYVAQGELKLQEVALHILLTAACQTMGAEHFVAFKQFVASSQSHINYCYALVSDWLQSGERATLRTTALRIERFYGLPKCLKGLTAAQWGRTWCLPCINACLLEQLLTEVKEHNINVSSIRECIALRRTLAYYDEYAPYYECLAQVANMQEFYLQHAEGFHTLEAAALWQEYTQDYYRMDSYYRAFHQQLEKCQVDSNAVLSDLCKEVAKVVEGLYTQWFLEQLGANWTLAAESEMAQYGELVDLAIRRQRNFYGEKVRASGQRIFVIISDALRYEVAAELSQLLTETTQSKVKLSSMQGVFPTVTKYGMAALLPHGALTIQTNEQGKVVVLADGLATEAPYRQRILQRDRDQSVALKYRDLIGYTSTQRKALVKGQEVIYIYHDRIDAAGHSAEASIAKACSEAIDDLRNLVRIIINEFKGTRIYITADHGFLYTRSPLREEDKVAPSVLEGKAIELERRYALLPWGSVVEHLLPVKLRYGGDKYQGYTPRENLRLKVKGAGLSFVHGGISLQEMVVPLIEVHYLRSSTREYRAQKEQIDTQPVEIALVSATHKISNLLFALEFYQREPVQGSHIAATYLITFVDEAGQAVSDTCKLIADKTSERDEERTQRVNFNLRQRKYSATDKYYLVIADENGRQVAAPIEFQINIAFAFEEFDFL